MRRLALAPALLLACSGQAGAPAVAPEADVTAVTVSGAAGDYRFAVTLRSPDTGCAQYADWWEVLDDQGALKYRRVLAHSHVNEQPFTRSGGPVEVAADQVVWVQAHMNVGGYGGVVFRGTPGGGFRAASPPGGWADLSEAPPQPNPCAF